MHHEDFNSESTVFKITSNLVRHLEDLYTVTVFIPINSFIAKVYVISIGLISKCWLTSGSSFPHFRSSPVMMVQKLAAFEVIPLHHHLVCLFLKPKPWDLDDQEIF